MSGKNSKTREARVYGLLEELGKNIERELPETYYLGSDDETSQNVLKTINQDNIKGTRSNLILSTVGDVELKVDTRKNRPWTSLPVDRNKTIQQRAPKEESKRAITPAEVRTRVVSSAANISGGASDTSLSPTSSKVQQLRLFWDKFFLMETEKDRSNEHIDKNSFLSAAKCHIFDKPMSKNELKKSKSMRKSATKFIEKAIPPTRYPISFRMIPSQQKQSVTKAKRKSPREKICSELDLVVSREVSTYMSKLPTYKGDLGTCSEAESVFTQAENNDEPSYYKSEINEKDPGVSQAFKNKLQNIFLVEQLKTHSKETNKKENEVGKHMQGDTSRQKGYVDANGVGIIFRYQHIMITSQEYGVIITTDDAVIISSTLVKMKKRERKLRKNTTLLPCYYCNTQQDVPLDIMSMGDFLREDSKINRSIEKQNNEYTRKNFKVEKLIHYERFTFDSNSVQENSTNLKLTISNEHSAGKVLFHFLIGFTSAVFIALVLIFMKLSQNMLL